MPTPCHCHALRHATRVLTQHYDAALAPSGVTTPQFAMLRTIERMGATSISAVARRLGLDRTTLGRNLKPLLEAGLVSRAEDKQGQERHDGRERLISVTPKGRSVIARALPLWEGTQDHLAEKLGRHKLDQLRRLLTDIETAART